MEPPAPLMCAGGPMPYVLRVLPAGRQNTKGPGDWVEVAVQVAVMPSTTTVSDVADRLSPEATVPVSGPVDTALPAASAGLELPVNVVVPEPFLVRVSVDLTEFAEMAIGVVIADVDTLMVAAVPLAEAVSVADPEPQIPQLNEMVAVVGVTASATGAITSTPATVAAVPSTALIASLPRFMEFPSGCRMVEAAHHGSPGGMARSTRRRCAPRRPALCGAAAQTPHRP